MTKVKSYSVPDGWNCLAELLEILPRSMDASKTIKLAVENLLEKVQNKPFISLDNFETEITVPDLPMDLKLWKKLLKDMSIPDVRDLHKLMTKRQSLVDDEIYRRTL